MQQQQLPDKCVFYSNTICELNTNELHKRFAQNQHVVIDNFLVPDILQLVQQEFAEKNIYQNYPNEDVLVQNKWENIPQTCRIVLETLSSPTFRNIVQEIGRAHV